MKSVARILLVLSLFAGVARAQVPALIGVGFEAYKASGSKDAIAAWLRNAPPSAGINVEGLPPDIGPGFEKPGAFGPMDSYEIIASYSPTVRLRRIYAVAYFPQGPLFFRFDLYRTAGNWVTYGLKLNLDPEQVLPPELIEKTG